MAGSPVRRGEQVAPARIEDVAPTVLHLLGLGVPEEMDGRVLEEALTTDYMSAHPVQFGHPGDQADDKEPTGWEHSDQEAEVAERLRALGYLE
jgi:arylsulfatase A-like enzyme